MDPILTVSLLLGLMFLLLAAGVWIAPVLMAVAAVAIDVMAGRPAGSSIATTAWSASSSWMLTALPMFIWMGDILFHSRLSEDMFKGLSPLMRRWPGGLLHTNVMGCTLFGSVSGSSVATLTTVGKMTIPELRKRGYPEHLIVSTLAGPATLGLMIPPSIIMIVYGVAAEVSIAKLFIAGVIPGIMLATLFSGYVIVWALFNKDKVPQEEDHLTFAQRVYASRNLIPAVILIALVLGSIYTGVATATESAALGVVGALVLSAVQGSLNRENFMTALMGATRLYCMIALILAGASFLTLAMGYIGLPRHLAEWIGGLGLSPLALILALMVFYIILGCFLDGISMVVLTMGVILPSVERAGIDLIWFGIYLVLVVEMAQVTPPVGFNLFVLQGMTKKEITWIARQALPMFALMVVAVLLIWFFPGIITWLPKQMS